MTQNDSLPTADPQISDQIFSQAVTCHQSGDLQEAERLYRLILQINPRHADSNHNIGMVLVQTNRAVAGLPYFKAAAEIDPNKEQYWLSYINALIDTDQYGLARQVLMERREHGLAGAATDLLDAHLTERSTVDELTALFNQGDFSKAEILAQSLTERFPQRGFGWKALGVAYLNQGRYVDALAPLQNVAALYPLDAENQFNLGAVYEKQGKYAEAVECYRHSIAIDPGNSTVHFSLGTALFEMGSLNEGEICFNKALETSPDFTEAVGRLNDFRRTYQRRTAFGAVPFGHQNKRVLSAGSGNEPAKRFNLLDYLRNHYFLGKLMPLFGGLMFVYGMYQTMDKNVGTKYAVKVDNQIISMETFNAALNKNSVYNKRRFAVQFTPEFDERRTLRKAALDALINQQLLRTAAIRRGVKVTDGEMERSIAAIPVFQNNGQFDLGLYKRVLANNNITPQTFEKTHRYDLLDEKMRRTIITSVQVTEQELKNLYHKEHDPIMLSYVAVSPSDVARDVTITKKEREDFFQSNRQLFMTPEKLSMSFIRLSVDHKKTSDPASQEELERYFNIHLNRYQGSGTVVPTFQSVRAKVVEDLRNERYKKVLLEQAATARYRHASQPDLKPVAKELGLPVRTADMFSATAPPPEFSGEGAALKSIFALKDGEIGGPFETATAVYLVQVSGRKSAEPASFESVIPLIDNKIRNQKAIELSRIKAQEALTNFSQGKPSPRTHETMAFNYDGSGTIPGIGVSPELMAEAITLTPQNAAARKIYKIASSWYAVRLKKRIAASEDDYGRVRGDLLKRIIFEKQQQKMAEWFAKQRSEVKIAINKQLADEFDQKSVTRR